MTPSEFVSELRAVKREVDILNADSAAYCSELVIAYRMPNDKESHIGGAFHEDFSWWTLATRWKFWTAHNACTKSRPCVLCDCEKCVSDMLTRDNEPFAKIEAVEHFDNDTLPRWTFDTDLLCEEFPIMDGEKLYCMAIVFRLADLPRMVAK